jgi:hypothetical protein
MVLYGIVQHSDMECLIMIWLLQGWDMIILIVVSCVQDDKAKE